MAKKLSTTKTELHIGKLIRQHLEEKGMTKSEFGRRINTSPQNIYGIFRRKSIDTNLLQTISQVLEFDFFQYYTSGMAGDPQSDKPTKDFRTMQQLLQENESLKKENTILVNEVGYLKEIYELNKKKSVS
jgi:transcriptional regulator with XRE-family HTH domain